jgi:hypothetical protein
MNIKKINIIKISIIVICLNSCIPSKKVIKTVSNEIPLKVKEVYCENNNLTKRILKNTFDNVCIAVDTILVNSILVCKDDKIILKKGLDVRSNQNNIELFFEENFKNDSIEIYLNNKTIFKDFISTVTTKGIASSVNIVKHEHDDFLKIKINSRYLDLSIDSLNYCRLRIKKKNNDLILILTNKNVSYL